MEVKANNPILYKGTGTPYLAIFDNQGIPVMNPLRFMPPHKPTEDTDDSMVKFLDSGCGLNVGVIIERFE